MVLAGCGNSSETAPVSTYADAGPGTCAAGELTLDDGTCQPAGVPPERCAPGFVPDQERGCQVVLPAEPCDPGLMALPGEEQCRPVAPCSAEPYGEAPAEPSTQYVDGAYGGGDSDGSVERPWTIIEDGIAAAEPGAVVAIAAGSYAEDLIIDQPVRLWGHCPDTVEIVGDATGLAAVLILDHADGTELHDLAVRGYGNGVLMTGSRDLWLDRVWVHDTRLSGIFVEDYLGTSSFRVTRSLVEGAGQGGIYALGASAVVDGCAIRDSRSNGNADVLGIGASTNAETGRRATLVLRGSVLEGHQGVGLYVGVSDVIMDATVVRDTQTNPASQLAGPGLVAQDWHDSVRASELQVTRSVIEANLLAGVYVSGAIVTMEDTTIGDTQPTPAGVLGYGVYLEPQPESLSDSTVTLRTSTIARNHTVNISQFSSSLGLEAVHCLAANPRPSDGFHGRCVNVQPLPGGSRPQVTIRSSVVADSRDLAVYLQNADATIERTLAVGTLPRAADDLHGDGFATAGSSMVALVGNEVRESSRAALAVFGGTVTLRTNDLVCNPIDFVAQEALDGQVQLDDRGGNRCYCEAEEWRCRRFPGEVGAPDPL